MKKQIRTQKGFTLIELIIVLAIFAIIMTLVMSYVDPVSKLMGRSSMKEKTASYVDNIDEYVQKSLRYASYVRIFENDFAETKSPYNPISEEAAVRDFIDDFYDGAVVNNNGDKLKGKVHVLKLCNENTLDGVSIKPGTIVEDVYDFTAGDSIPVTYSELNETNGKWETKKTSHEFVEVKDENDNVFPHAVIENKTTTLAVNPEHLENFSYYYALGYKTFDPVCEDYTNSGANSYSSNDAKNLYNLPVDSKYYYNELHTAKDNSGNDITISQGSFAISVVAYQNNVKGCNMIKTNKKISPTDTVPVTVFRSPSSMSIVSMSFPNLYSTTDNKSCVCKEQIERTYEIINGNPVEVKNYKKKENGELVLDINGNPVLDKEKLPGKDKKDANGNSMFKYVTVYDQAFSKYKAVSPDPTATTTDNIYIIFTVPSEIYT